MAFDHIPRKGLAGPRAARRLDSVGVALILSFAAVVTSFVGATCYGELRARDLEEAALTIEGDAAPSIRRLANARTELRREQLLIHRALDEGASFGGVPEVESGRALLHNELAEYQRLPMHAEEQRVWAATRVALARMDADVTEVLHALKHGDAATARARAEDLDESSEVVADRLWDGIDANVVEARRLAAFIGASRRHGTVWAVVLDGAGVVLASFAAARVLRVTRAHAQAVQAYRVVAERRADELEVFATRMAHDVRTPLAGASLSLEVVERHGTADERVHRAVKRARGALKQTAQIVEGLLEFARAGARPDQNATACVADIAEEVTVAMKPRADQVAATLEVRAASHALVACAEGMVASALGNLVANALTWVEGSARRCVVIDVTDDGAFVKTTVSDTGPGLPPDVDAATLFQPYVRGEAARGRGLGLGLATAKRIVDAYGGRIGVRSSPAGAQFWFTLPSVSGSGRLRPRDESAAPTATEVERATTPPSIRWRPSNRAQEPDAADVIP